MSHVVLDDHLLRDLLADAAGRDLRRILRTRRAATTNLYYLRLCRSAVAAPGGALTGRWAPDRRAALARALLVLPDDLRIVSLRSLAFDVATLAERHGLSSLGAEAVAAAMILEAPLYVAAADDGARIRDAARAEGVTYRAVES